MIISTNNPLYIKSVEVSQTSYGYFVDIWASDSWTTTDFYIDDCTLNVVFNPYKSKVFVHDLVFGSRPMSLFTDEIANHYMVACIYENNPLDKNRIALWQKFI